MSLSYEFIYKSIRGTLGRGGGEEVIVPYLHPSTIDNLPHSSPFNQS